MMIIYLTAEDLDGLVVDALRLERRGDVPDALVQDLRHRADVLTNIQKNATAAHVNKKTTAA